MKRILFTLILTISSTLSFAGVIMTSSNERLEDVTITSENDTAIVYMQDGVEKSIAIEQVSAILYDNGKYVEFVKQHLDSKQDITDSVEVIDLNVDIDDMDIYTIELDSCAYLSAFEKKWLNNHIKQIHNWATRKQTSSNSSRIVGREAYITAYLQSRARGYSMFRADVIAQMYTIKKSKKYRANKSIEIQAQQP